MIFHSNWNAVSSTDQHIGPLSVSGTLIFAGSGSFTSFQQEILRIGPKINAYKVCLMLGASWSSSLEKRQSHQTVELIECAFGGQQWFSKWNKNIEKKKKKNYESLAQGAEIAYLIFVDLPHFLRTKWQLSIYKFYSTAVISFMLIHHTETRRISLYVKLHNICETQVQHIFVLCGFLDPFISRCRIRMGVN